MRSGPVEGHGFVIYLENKYPVFFYVTFTIPRPVLGQIVGVAFLWRITSFRNKVYDFINFFA